MMGSMYTLRRVMTFATGKGGTGKTSCSANVAGLAAAAGWRTLAIDMDPQANLGHDLGYHWEGKGDNGDALVNALIASQPLRPVLTNVRQRLDVIPGGSRLDDLEDLVAGRERRGADGRTLLRDALEPIAGDYDLIVIDTPPSRRSALVQLALVASRWVTVPTRSDRSSIEGLRMLGEQLTAAREFRPDLEVLGAVLFDVGSGSTAIRRNAAEDITDALGGAAPQFEAVIRHTESAAVDAREKGRLVHEMAEVVHDAEPFWKALREGRRPERAPGTAPALAEDYALLTQEILTRVTAMETAEQTA